jgi:hypothetical protein
MTILSDVKHWRSRVEQTLLVARELKHEEARRVTLELALAYGRLAELAERRLAQEAAAAASAASKPVFQAKSRVAGSAAFSSAPAKYRLSAAISGRMAMGDKPLSPRSIP